VSLAPARCGMLALVTDGFGARGGIARYNSDFLGAAAQALAGQNLVILPRRAGPAEGSIPAGMVQAEPRQSRIAYGIASLRETRRRRPGLIFCGHVYHAPLAAALARAADARLIVQLHGIEIWGAVPRRCTAALERADLILAVSRDTRRRALQLLRLSPERVVVINNTVRPEFVPGDRMAARARFSLGDEAVILTVGRLDRAEGYKGHDRILPLVGELARRGMPATYLIAGEGDDRARLENLARDAGAAERIRFLGHVPDSQLPDLYRAADLFAMPSSGEGFGIAFIEAMACGPPAIGLAEGGARDALGDGALGACVSPAGFAAEFLRLVSERSHGGKELAKSVQQRFGQSVFAARVRLHLRGLRHAA
jgi:phosphatidyl-myo-inositol dimannoside synthase